MNLTTRNATIVDVEEIAFRGRGVYFLRLIELEPGNVEAELAEAWFAYHRCPGETGRVELEQGLRPVLAFEHPFEPAASLELLAAIREQGLEACADRIRDYVEEGLAYGAEQAAAEAAELAEHEAARESSRPGKPAEDDDEAWHIPDLPAPGDGSKPPEAAPAPEETPTSSLELCEICRRKPATVELRASYGSARTRRTCSRCFAAAMLEDD